MNLRTLLSKLRSRAGLDLVLANAETSEVRNSSLFGNGRLLTAKDILLDLAGRCFWQLGYELDSLGGRLALLSWR